MYQALQGNIGLGRAVAYFTSNKISVSIPLNDTQKYDLVVDIKETLYKVQVKTSRFKEAKSSNYTVGLKNSGGGGKGSTIRNFDNTLIDYVFIFLNNGKMYLIPARDISAKSGIVIGEKYRKYEVLDGEW